MPSRCLKKPARLVCRWTGSVFRWRNRGSGRRGGRKRAQRRNRWNGTSAWPIAGRIGFGEVGGWAVGQDHRWTLESLRIVFAIVALLELLGGRAGVATATSRHSSATILRRIGLPSLQADGVDLPPYYDSQYSCEMEVLRFDSRYPNPKYREWVDQLVSCLSTSPVICRTNTM
jgi:hypothetical protein